MMLIVMVSLEPPLWLLLLLLLSLLLLARLYSADGGPIWRERRAIVPAVAVVASNLPLFYCTWRTYNDGYKKLTTRFFK